MALSKPVEKDASAEIDHGWLESIADPDNPWHQYDPLKFGHPHFEAEDQPTEPFWHQVPVWARPGQSFFYYPQWQQYSMSRLYTIQRDDGAFDIVHYHPILPPNRDHAPAAQASVRCIGVYIDEDFYEEVPYQTLIRFAAATRYALGASDEMHDDASVPGSWELCRPKVKSQRSSRTRVDSLSPLGGECQNSQASEEPRPERRSSKIATQSPKLVLRRDGLRLLKAKPVRAVLKWMKDNDLPGKQKLLDLGPTTLETSSLKDLLDIYAAILAFGILPKTIGGRYRTEVMARLTCKPPSLTTVRRVQSRITAEDPISTRLITSVHDFWEQGSYTEERWTQILASLLDREHDGRRDDDFCSRTHEIFEARRHSRESDAPAEAIPAVTEERDVLYCGPAPIVSHSTSQHEQDRGEQNTSPDMPSNEEGVKQPAQRRKRGKRLRRSRGTRDDEAGTE